VDAATEFQALPQFNRRRKPHVRVQRKPHTLDKHENTTQKNKHMWRQMGCKLEDRDQAQSPKFKFDRKMFIFRRRVEHHEIMLSPSIKYTSWFDIKELTSCENRHDTCTTK
jgi:hypothetical protein